MTLSLLGLESDAGGPGAAAAVPRSVQGRHQGKELQNWDRKSPLYSQVCIRCSFPFRHKTWSFARVCVFSYSLHSTQMPGIALNVGEGTDNG